VKVMAKKVKVKGIDIEKLAKQFDFGKTDTWDSFMIESKVIADNHVVQWFEFNIRVNLTCVGKLPVQLTGELALNLRNWVGLSTTLVSPITEAVSNLSELVGKISDFLIPHVEFTELVLIDLINNKSARLSIQNDADFNWEVKR
jgi:hypothetical protein